MKDLVSGKETTFSGQCYEHIQEMIINGTLAPGQKLKVEELKSQFGVGQSPIREALSRLVTSGLVEMHDNKGFRVARVSEADVRDTYRTFLQIELLALMQAIEFGDDAWEAGIVAALHQLALIENKKGPVAYADWLKRNYAFHVSLITGCNSPLLLELRAMVYRRFERYCYIAFTILPSELELNHKEHKQLAQSVLQRDAQKAQELMEHHILGALEDVVKMLKKNQVI